MARMGQRLCRILLLLALLAPVPGRAVAQPAMLVLDASVSMWGGPNGGSRIAAVREAVAGLMAGWPAGRPVGLVAYGHRRAQDCADVEVLRPPLPGAEGLARTARGLVPRGRTPIAEAVRQAAEALGPGGGSVILVTDGIEACHPDPCAVAQTLARAAPRLVLHAIAFDLADPPALAQLRCMAEATGGRAFLARDGAELAAALAAAAAAPGPGPRAASPRAEPVPQPSLVVTLRLCAQCDPMTGEATILLRRGAEAVARDGEPFGRFFDLPPGDYALSVEAGPVRRGPIAVRVPPSGTGRAEVVLDAGWLVAQARSEPSGHALTDRARISREGAGAQDGAAILLPPGPHRLEARIGIVTGAAVGEVVAGDVTLLPIPLRFGTLRLRREGFGSEAPRVTVTPLGVERPIFADWPEGEVAAIPLPPGRYRVSADHGDREAIAGVEIVAEAESPLTLRPGR